MVFFALGLLFAWAKWFKNCKGFNEAIEEHLELVESLNLLYLKQTSLSKEFESLPTIETQIQETPPQTLLEDHSESEIKLLKEQLEEIQLKQQEELAELSTLREENANLKEQLTVTEEINNDDTISGIEVMEAILNDFADEHVKDHTDFGILFQGEPVNVDDLTQIDLLTPNISDKLYDLGVYRYRQIALWSHQQFDKILEELDINPNQLIGKNGFWQKEAARLHKRHHKAN